MADMAEIFTTTVPAHVPPDLVRPFPYILGRTTTAQPHSFIKEIHEGPEIFWVEKVITGTGGAWVPRRYEDLANVYFDTEHYSALALSPYAKMVGETWQL